MSFAADARQKTPSHTRRNIIPSKERLHVTTPAFLGASRAKKTRAKAQEAAGAQGHEPNGAIPSTDSDGVRKADSGASNTKRRGKGVLEGPRERARGRRSVSAPDHESIVAGLRALATRPQMLETFEAISPGAIVDAVDAMLTGATVSGAHGAADRAALWRILGMPWVGEGASARQVGNVLGAAVGTAVAAIEQGRRHDAATVGPVIEAKPLEMQPDLGGGLVFAQHEAGQEAGSQRQEAGKAGSQEGRGQAAQAAPPRRSR